MCAVIMVLACREFPGRQLCKVLRLLCRQQSFFGRSHVITYVILLSRKLCKKASILCPINKQSEFSFTHGSILVDLFQVCCLCFCLLQAKKKKSHVSFFFWAHSQNYGKWPLASSCPSGCTHGSTLLPLDVFSWNFTVEYFSNICREDSSFIEIWQE